MPRRYSGSSIQLFIGNRLATAEIVTRDGARIDLRNIRSPIVCFCSKGDDITPPPQALGWICDLYQKDEDILTQGQTIVYAIHESAGHLGIFVSSGVARKEHGEFASNIDLIDVLPPGLYEAVMTRKTADTIHPELVSGEWILLFAQRTLNDIRAIVRPDPENEHRFATVRRGSQRSISACIAPCRNRSFGIGQRAHRADAGPGRRSGRDSKHAIRRQSAKRRARGDPRRRVGGRRTHRWARRPSWERRQRLPGAKHKRRVWRPNPRRPGTGNRSCPLQDK